MTSKIKTPSKMKTTSKMKMSYKIIGPLPENYFLPPPLPFKKLPDFFCLLTLTATPQLTLKWKCYLVSKKEMEFHMINIMYVALPMCKQTKNQHSHAKRICAKRRALIGDALTTTWGHFFYRDSTSLFHTHQGKFFLWAYLEVILTGLQ